MTSEWIDRIYATSMAIGIETAKAMERTDASASPTYARIGSGQAVYCGSGSPLTQVSWLAYKSGFDPADLEAVDRFYKDRTSSWEYIVTPFSAPALLAEVVRRGWTEVQYENVMGQVIKETKVDLPDGVEIHLVQERDRLAWADLATRGFFLDGPPPGFENLNDIIVKTENIVGFVASFEGTPAGAASLMFGEDAVYLGGASTLPEFRGRGIQTALLQTRLAHAHSMGMTLALCEALAGTQSQRNQERAGFQVVYTKMVLTKPG